MSFDGFSQTGLDFYAALEVDNSKRFWLDHKATYEEYVLEPTRSLVEELSEEFGGYKIFRPNRDVRFSADKSPYKTHIGVIFEEGSYLQFSSAGLACGAGYYTMSRDQLARYRDAVVAEPSGTELAGIVSLIARSVEILSVDALKTVPRGYSAEHPRIELLRNKGIVSWKEWPVEEWLFSPAVAERVSEFFRLSRPLTVWLNRYVGPSLEERKPRA